MIDPQNTLAILTIVLLLVLIGYVSEQTNLGRKISAPLIILLLSFVAGNVGILPGKAPVYDVIQSLLVPLAIPMLLFQADLRTVFAESKKMVFAFLLVAAFTVFGAIVGAQLIDMGPESNELVGILTASYIGGSANFVATAQALNFQESSLYTAALTADALGAIFFLSLLMALPTINFVEQRFSSAAKASAPNTNIANTFWDSKSAVTEMGIITTLFISALICLLGVFIADLLPISGTFIIAITILALLIANFAPQQLKLKIQFDHNLGTIFMYIFFATIGLGADVSSMAGAALPMLAFLVIVVLIHVCLICWLGARFNFTLPEMMIASSACILGPAAAAAIAASKGWRHLVTPGIMVGVLGYAIATIIGISLAAVVAHLN